MSAIAVTAVVGPRATATSSYVRFLTEQRCSKRGRLASLAGRANSDQAGGRADGAIAAACARLDWRYADENLKNCHPHTPRSPLPATATTVPALQAPAPS